MNDSTIAITSSTTDSIGTPVVSIWMASGAIASGDAARVESLRSRSARAVATSTSADEPAALWAGSLARRRPAPRAMRPGRSSDPHPGNTTVPMSRPSMTTPATAAHFVLPGHQCAPNHRVAGDAAAPLSMTGVRIAVDTSTPSMTTRPAFRSKRARSLTDATAASSCRSSPRRGPSRRRRDTSPRCRYAGIRVARPARARSSLPRARGSVDRDDEFPGGRGHRFTVS